MFYGMMYPYTIKKEHAGQILRSKKIMLSIITICMAIVVGIMHFVVYPKLLKLYIDFGVTLPFATQYEPYIVGAVVFVSAIGLWYFNFSGILDQEFVDKLTKYSSGTDIPTRQLVNLKYDAWVMVFLALAVGFFVFAIISPIYSITSSLN